jgi:regulator of RNase E activity RraB
MEEKFINECTEMGYDYTDIKDFIEDKGLPVLSHDLLTDCINQP